MKKKKSAQEKLYEIYRRMPLKKKWEIASILMEPACKLRKMGFNDEEIRLILNIY